MMIKILKTTVATLAFISAAPAAATADESISEFFIRDRSNNWTQPIGGETVYGSLPVARELRANKAVADLTARTANAMLGPEWVASAVGLAKLESGLRCNARGPKVRSHGGDRALGALQVMPRTARAMGLDPSRLTECEYGITAGIMHMRMCLDSGVHTRAQMAACHVAGVKGWNRRLARRPERYKQQYIRLAMRIER
jgi:hypothetical protein